MFELVNVGKDKLIGEIIRLELDTASIQVYNSPIAVAPTVWGRLSLGYHSTDRLGMIISFPCCMIAIGHRRAFMICCDGADA